MHKMDEKYNNGRNNSQYNYDSHRGSDLFIEYIDFVNSLHEHFSEKP